MSKGLRVFVAGIVVLGIWGHARFGGQGLSSVTAAPQAGVFAEPLLFVAVPGGTFPKINLRAGPGSQFYVKGEVPRGARVMGVARRADLQGAFWIELADGQGFAKESVLSLEVK